MEMGCDMYIVYSYIVSRSTSSLERRETNEVETLATIEPRFLYSGYYLPYWRIAETSLLIPR